MTTTYQWLRDGSPIPGAGDPTYVPTLDDAGHALSVQATGALAGLPLVTAVSNTLHIPLTTNPALMPAGDITVNGSRKIGTTLTLSGPTWDPGDATSNYQWLRDGSPIGGATATSYALVPADFGHTIAVVATGHKDGYTDNTITSDPVTPVVGDAIQFVMKPRITGSATLGKLLTADPGQWSGGAEGSGMPTFGYQWRRGETPISGAVAQTYQVTTADIGKALSVMVTATRPAYKAGKFTTASVTVARMASTVTATLSKKSVTKGQKAIADAGREVRGRGRARRQGHRPRRQEEAHDGLAEAPRPRGTGSCTLPREPRAGRPQAEGGVRRVTHRGRRDVEGRQAEGREAEEEVK